MYSTPSIEYFFVCLHNKDNNYMYMMNSLFMKDMLSLIKYNR